MPAGLGPRRFWPGSSVWQIPQVFRNSRAPSSSARAPAPKQLSATVRDSPLTATERDKKNLPILSPNWIGTPQRLSVKDLLSRIRTDRRLEPSRLHGESLRQFYADRTYTPFLQGGSQSHNPSGSKPLKLT